MIYSSSIYHRNNLIYDDNLFVESVMDAKKYKILSHLYCNDSNYTTWVDDNIFVKDENELVHLADNNDLMLFRHPERTNIIDEANYLKINIRFKNDNILKNKIDKQINYYVNKYSIDEIKNMGLYEANFLFRYNNRRVENFNNYWWAEICRWQFRDQLSLPVALHENLLHVKVLSGNIRNNKMFIYKPEKINNIRKYTPATPKITLFFHVAKINNWIDVKNEILNAIKSSQLIHHLDNIVINETDGKDYEFPTLEKLREFSKRNPDQLVIYVHTKGVSNPRSEDYRRWRKWLIEFSIIRWKTILELFIKYKDIDCAGVKYMNEIPHHFSGNFWWARTNYISKLDEIRNSPYPFHRVNQERFKCETWLLNTPIYNVISLDNNDSNLLVINDETIRTFKNNIKIYRNNAGKVSEENLY